MDGRGRPVKREERQGNPVRDEQGNLVYEDAAPSSSAGPQNDEGVREINGSRRPSTTMGTDGALHMPSMERMAQLDGDREQDELRRSQPIDPSTRPRRGSTNRLHLSEGIIESSTRHAPSSSATSKGDVGSTVQNTAAMNQFLYNLHQQQMAASGMAGGPLKTFPNERPAGNAGLVPSAALESQVNLGDRPSMGFVDSEAASMAPADPERPIGPRGRRPSIGQLF